MSWSTSKTFDERVDGENIQEWNLDFSGFPENAPQEEMTKQFEASKKATIILMDAMKGLPFDVNVSGHVNRDGDSTDFITVSVYARNRR